MKDMAKIVRYSALKVFTCIDNFKTNATLPSYSQDLILAEPPNLKNIRSKLVEIYEKKGFVAISSKELVAILREHFLKLSQHSEVSIKKML